MVLNHGILSKGLIYIYGQDQCPEAHAQPNWAIIAH